MDLRKESPGGSDLITCPNIIKQAVEKASSASLRSIASLQRTA
jgi:hypothetical protein